MDLSVYIDETTLYLGGEPCLLYGAVVTEDARPGIRDLLDIRRAHNVPRDVEIKWHLSWGTPEQKAAIKEAVVVALQQFQFLVSIAKTADKNVAFCNLLAQVHTYALYCSADSVQICFDRDCFSDFRAARAALLSWSDLPCTLFARGESDLTAMLQYADMFAGAFAYMVHKQNMEQVPEILFRERVDGDWMMRLDEYFYLLLRRGIPGVQSKFDPEREELDPNFWVFSSRGLGVCLHGSFSDGQLQLLHEVLYVFKGPMD